MPNGFNETTLHQKQNDIECVYLNILKLFGSYFLCDFENKAE